MTPSRATPTSTSTPTPSQRFPKTSRHQSHPSFDSNQKDDVPRGEFLVAKCSRNQEYAPGDFVDSNVSVAVQATCPPYVRVARHKLLGNNDHPNKYIRPKACVVDTNVARGQKKGPIAQRTSATYETAVQGLQGVSLRTCAI